jgi:hypothetical protein
MGLGDAHIDPLGYAGVRRRPQVRLSAVGEAWAYFSAQAGTWLLTGFVAMIGNWAVLAVLSSLFGKHQVARDFWVPFPPSGSWLNVLAVAVVNGFFVGGMFRMACLQLRGHRIGVSDLFSVTDVLTQLALGSALYALICAVGGVLVIPGFIAAGVLMFTVPLIVDARLDATEAVRQSWYALKGQWLGATLFQFVMSLMLGIGYSCCCVGVPVTMPLYCLSISVLYRDALLAKAADLK